MLSPDPLASSFTEHCTAQLSMSMQTAGCTALHLDVLNAAPALGLLSMFWNGASCTAQSKPLKPPHDDFTRRGQVPGSTWIRDRQAAESLVNSQERSILVYT